MNNDEYKAKEREIKADFSARREALADEFELVAPDRLKKIYLNGG